MVFCFSSSSSCLFALLHGKIKLVPVLRSSASSQRTTLAAKPTSSCMQEDLRDVQYCNKCRMDVSSLLHKAAVMGLVA